MPSILAMTDGNHGYTYLFVSFADTPTVTYATVQRVVSATGVSTPVRVNGSSNATGTAIELSDGVAILYDAEAPLDTAVMYVAYPQGSTTAAASTADVVLPSGSTAWLKNAIYPGTNQRLSLQLPTLGPSGCLPGNGLVFIGIDSETYPARGLDNIVVNRRNVAPVVRVQGGIAGSVNIASRTFADRDRVVPAPGDDPGVSVLGPGTPVLLQAPAAYGIPDRYGHASQAMVARLSPNHKLSWRTIAVPYTEVDSPAGLSYGVAGSRWRDLCTEYATLNQMNAAGLSWVSVMQGRAGDPSASIVSGWRTYAQETAQFATYAAVIATGMTYQQMTVL